MLNNNNVNIFNIDTISSLREQIDVVRKSKIIIVEMGSAFSVNIGQIH